MRRHRSPAGGVLLEVVVALAIFIGAALAVMACVDRAADSLERTRGMQRAADLARTAMAQLEAGLVMPTTLNGPVPALDGLDRSGLPYSGGASGEGESGWELEISTEPSDFGSLTKVMVTAVRRRAESGTVMHSYTLTQLVRLSDRAGESAGLVRR